MSRGPENTFIASVHRHLPPKNEFYWMKNNNPFNSGIADCWYSGALDLWVEYKFIVLPKRDETVVDLTRGKEPPLSALQQDWLSNRKLEGRNVWVVVGCKEGGVMFSVHEALTAQPAGEYRERMNTRADIAKRILTFCS